MKKKLSFFATRVFVFIALIALQALVFLYLMYAIEAISNWIQAGLYVSSLFLVIWIVNKRQDPGYKIAWIILILLLPVFGMSMYFFFSQRKLGPKDRRIGMELYSRTMHLMATDGQADRAIRQQDADAARQSRYISNVSMYPLYQNTQATYFPTGETFYEDLLRALKDAKRYIFMEYFIVEQGVMWDSILEILVDKAAQGLDVRFMYDDIGCISKLPGKYYRQLCRKGIKCQAFNPLRPALNSLFNNRDHRKITVIDGHTAYCSGANLADEYINVVERFGVWKDASIKLQGEGAWSLLLIFLHLWAFTDKEKIDFDSYIPTGTKKDSVQSDGFVQPFADMPFDDEYVSEGVFLNMINNAKEYVYINTPYLIPTNELLTALTNAAQSGVDVRITVPHIPDKKIVFMVTQSYYAALLSGDVRIYEYTPGFIHSKTFICDDKFGIVGTPNLDYRSLYLHFECGVWMYGCSCLADMRRDYEQTILESQEIRMEDTYIKNPFKRLFVAILRIFGPLM